MTSNILNSHILIHMQVQNIGFEEVKAIQDEAKVVIKKMGFNMTFRSEMNFVFILFINQLYFDFQGVC